MNVVVLQDVIYWLFKDVIKVSLKDGTQGNIDLGKDFSLKLTILLHDLHIEILTVVEYNLYA